MLTVGLLSAFASEPLRPPRKLCAVPSLTRAAVFWRAVNRLLANSVLEFQTTISPSKLPVASSSGATLIAPQHRMSSACDSLPSHLLALTFASLNSLSLNTAIDFCQPTAMIRRFSARICEISQFWPFSQISKELTGLWDWHTKKRFFHTSFVHFFGAVSYQTKKLKRLNRMLYTQI